MNLDPRSLQVARDMAARGCSDLVISRALGFGLSEAAHAGFDVWRFFNGVPVDGNASDASRMPIGIQWTSRIEIRARGAADARHHRVTYTLLSA